MKKKTSLLWKDNDWNFAKIKVAEQAIREIAIEELKLNTYPNQIEIIGSDQMLEAYASNGLPMMYNHWSFGKHFIQQQYSYRKGYKGLAYEIVINSNPCISYLMEENSMTMQALVIAHAAYGHNHFFKNNYLFKQWTDAEGILDYMLFAKNYIAKCEEKYGYDIVEKTLDACHSIINYGVDKYRRPKKLNKKEEAEKQKEREEYVQQQANELWSTLPQKKKESEKIEERFPNEPQENIMYFIEKFSPVLEPWQREIVRIVRKISQYFYPQRQTKLMNEGWASFTHYYIMNRLWEKGLINDGSYLEFIHSHSSVLHQLQHDHKYYSGFNPYALGFAMFNDIRRICTEPTPEDHEYFPHIVNSNWLNTCLDAVENYRDESFVAQFLSPKLVREWKLFEITNKEKDDFVTVTSIQNNQGFNYIRRSLSQQYSVASYQPNIQIYDANLKSTRELKLRYTSINGVKLKDNKSSVIQHIKFLWGYHVSITED
jgi:spore cortex formation protein SpoVR/YcgB (stage V sporulation)